MTVPEFISSSSFANDYAIIDRIGDGGYSTVFLAASKVNRSQYVAAKRLNKQRPGKSAEVMTNRYKHEAQILSTLKHPNILHYEAAYDEKEYFYIVTEYLTGNDLFAQITVDDRTIKEKECRAILRSLLLAVQYLHDKNIVHRDIKLENILSTIDLKDDDSSSYEEMIKLIDFGFASYVEGNNLNDSVGTHYYAAPEIYKHEYYGKAVDMWSIGVVAYCLLYGQYPFYAKQKSILGKQILSGLYRFRSRNRAGEFVSAEMKSFIANLLVVNPAQRMTVEEALNHPFMKQERISFTTVATVLRAVQKFKRLVKNSKKVTKIDEKKCETASSVTSIDLSEGSSHASPAEDSSSFIITINESAKSNKSAKSTKSTATTNTMTSSSFALPEVFSDSGVWGKMKQRVHSVFSMIPYNLR
mmetsp:Transcript_30907/g.33776  ORF Transcript_30907/g.33776 Transcript_30907/m.33776 type:complete len:414 (-) Transcript_30907:202-1443(-)